MRQGLYTIHDRLAETYSAPMAIPEKIVMRQLEYIISDMSRLDVQDKECCIVGTWDNETAEIITKIPRAIADLSKMKEKQEERANG